MDRIRTGFMLSCIAMAKKWHDDDRFWKAYKPWMFSPRRWNEARGEVDLIVKRVELSPGATVLDLCCGPGRHTLELARRGFSVVAVDRTSDYLADAKTTARDEKLKVEFVKQDMRKFVRAGAFDAVINVYTSFGYFRDPADDRRVLTNVYRSLKSGGQLLMDMMGKELIARDFRPRDWHERDGRLMLEERKISHDWSWIDNRWILIDGKSRTEFLVSHRLYSAKELSELAKSTGFKSTRVFGDLGGADYGPGATRLVVVARK
jgi:SAM-dependent methyltransferase